MTWAVGICVWVGGAGHVVLVGPVVDIPGLLLFSSLSQGMFQTTRPQGSVGIGLFESTVVIFGGVGLGTGVVGEAVVRGFGWVGGGLVCWGIGWVSQ